MKPKKVVARIQTIAESSSDNSFPVKILLQDPHTENDAVYFDVENIHWANINGKYAIIIKADMNGIICH